MSNIKRLPVPVSLLILAEKQQHPSLPINWKIYIYNNNTIFVPPRPDYPVTYSPNWPPVLNRFKVSPSIHIQNNWRNILATGSEEAIQ